MRIIGSLLVATGAIALLLWSIRASAARDKRLADEHDSRFMSLGWRERMATAAAEDHQQGY